MLEIASSITSTKRYQLKTSPRDFPEIDLEESTCENRRFGITSRVVRAVWWELDTAIAFQLSHQYQPNATTSHEGRRSLHSRSHANDYSE